MRKLCLLVVVAGVATRFILQFLTPFFNGDEISLGNNIASRSYAELLFPLDTAQSAPPLYLLTQKFIISTFPFEFWINIKILSFLSSVAGLVLFYRLVRKQDPAIVFFGLVLFAFNPFLLSNSMTVKQYTLDLLGILILLNFYKQPGFRKIGFAFFCIWGLFSNIGLFSCAGYLIYLFFSEPNAFTFKDIVGFIKKHMLLFLAPLPYVLYFVWYMQQPGAAEMKEYMTAYWQDSFLPLNGGIFKYILYLIHGFWFNFYNGVELLGLFLFVTASVIVYPIIKKKPIIFNDEIKLLTAILAVHITLNVFQLYPLSGRLYVYLAPFFVLVLCSSISYLRTLLRSGTYFRPVIIMATLLTVGCYSLYLPSKENDVLALYKQLDEMGYKGKAVYGTDRALEFIGNFNTFTKFKLTDQNALQFHGLDSDLRQSNLLISRVHHKIGPLEKTAKEETVIQRMLSAGKLELVGKVDGYNLYRIK